MFVGRMEGESGLDFVSCFGGRVEEALSGQTDGEPNAQLSDDTHEMRCV